MKKRLFSLLLAVVMVVSILPFTALAADKSYAKNKANETAISASGLLYGASAQTNTAAMMVWRVDGYFHIGLAVDDTVRDAIQAAGGQYVDAENPGAVATINGKTATVDFLSFSGQDKVEYKAGAFYYGGKTGDMFNSTDHNNPFEHIFNNAGETPYWCVVKASDAEVNTALATNAAGTAAEFNVKVFDKSGNDILKFDDPIVKLSDSNRLLFGAVLRKADGSMQVLQLPSKGFSDTLDLSQHPDDRNSNDTHKYIWAPCGNWYVNIRINTGDGMAYLPNPYDLWDCTGYKLAENKPTAQSSNYTGGDRVYWYTSSNHTANNDFSKAPDITKENGAKYWNTNSGTMSSGWTFYFIFEELAPVSYDVEYYFENADGEFVKDDSKTESLTGLEGNTVTAPDKAFEGYTFDATNEGNILTATLTSNAPTETVLKRYYKISRYTVTWLDEDGTELEKDENVLHGAATSFDGTEPSKEATAQYTYQFDGWTPDVAPTVTADATYTAKYSTETNEYTVTYTDGVEHKEIFVDQSTTVDYGASTPAFVGTPNRFGYKFTGWSPAVAETVTADVTYTAQWQRIVFNTPAPSVIVTGLNTTDHVAYIIGRGNDMFVPGDNVTRAEAATMFFRLMTDEYRTLYWDDECSYSDVKADTWYNVAIATLENAGAIDDTAAGGKFRPNDPITRAELAVMAAQFCTTTGTIPGASFLDVTPSHWAYREISIVQFANWIEGYNGKFRPDDNLTRAECVSIINRILQRGAESEDMFEDMVTFKDNMNTAMWYYEAIQEAANSHDYSRTGKILTGEHFVAEKWTALKKAPDWAALEKAWAEVAKK